MPERIPFSQLWIEEEAYLKEIAASLHDGATIVEIGTAQGGSAYIFASATQGREVEIHSYDIAPSEEAKENLRGFDVHVHALSSVEGAERWTATCGNPVDLLFIDGSHTFLDVFKDFQSWLPYLRPGGYILFHDFDPVERGGVVHLGVRLFCETVLTTGCLMHNTHVGRILSTRISDSVEKSLDIEAFLHTWKEWGHKLERILYSKEVLIVGDSTSPQVRYVSRLLGCGSERIVESVEKSRDFKGTILLLERPLSQAGHLLLQESGRQAELIDDWTLNYLVAEGMMNVRDVLLDCVGERPVLFKFEELIQMLEHATGTLSRLDEIFAVDISDLEKLSSRCAFELVRLHYLENIARSLI